MMTGPGTICERGASGAGSLLPTSFEHVVCARVFFFAGDVFRGGCISRGMYFAGRLLVMDNHKEVI